MMPKHFPIAVSAVAALQESGGCNGNACALLLPARGEKVGMRGRCRCLSAVERSLNRNKICYQLRIAEGPPHPRFAQLILRIGVL
jgi:hypothetical protein